MHTHAHTHMYRTHGPQIGGAEGDDEFEERFLQCFGLGDAEEGSTGKKLVARTASQPSEEEREKLLREQQANSPWYVRYSSSVLYLPLRRAMV